jgi:hypothetical protein
MITTVNPYYDEDNELYVKPHLRTVEWVNAHKEELDQYLLEDYNNRLAKLPTPDNPISYFTHKNILDILVSIYFGSDIDLALASCGIPKTVYLHWKRQAIDHEGLARRFMILELAARAQFEQLHLKQLGLLSSIDTKASYFLLERATDKTAKYAPRSFVEVGLINASYMKELEELITSGAMSVRKIVEEVGNLEEEQLTYLLGVEVQYRKSRSKMERKKRDLLVKGKT